LTGDARPCLLRFSKDTRSGKTSFLFLDPPVYEQFEALTTNYSKANGEGSDPLGWGNNIGLFTKLRLQIYW